MRVLPVTGSVFTLPAERQHDNWGFLWGSNRWTKMASSQPDYVARPRQVKGNRRQSPQIPLDLPAGGLTAAG